MQPSVSLENGITFANDQPFVLIGGINVLEEEDTVMVVAQNVAHETKVTIGIRTADKIEIVEGLQGGETIVIEGNFALPDGTKVEVAKPEEKKNEEK